MAVNDLLLRSNASVRRGAFGGGGAVGAELAAVRHRVEAALGRFLLAKSTECAGLTEVLALARDFVLHSGKRVRPLFCYAGWLGGGGNADSDGVIAAAGSLELFHAFALIHDDIIDRSDLRRGRPALHRALADLHQRSGWSGDAGHAGLSLGILCGDLCFAWSVEMLHGCGLPGVRVRAAAHLADLMRREVVHGQFLDVVDQARGGSLDGALRIVLLKAAKYTVQRPLQIGGALAGAGPAVLRSYAAFGVPLGEAFQLRDDILGVFGDPAVTGKSIVDDLREGKPTVLIALARDRAGPAQLSRIARLYGNPDLDDAGAAALREIIADTGSLAAVEWMIEERTELAAAELDRAPVGEPARARLRHLAAALTARTC